MLGVLFACIVSVIAPAHAQRADRLPATDSALIEGTLPNGLRYYVRRNSRPANRVELRLVVAAGSLSESEPERGFAHLVEHMAFAGTTAFPGRQLLEYLESLGLRFGADVNAYTAQNETVYRLTLPGDDSAAVLRGVRILGEWARGIIFDSTALMIERDVLVEEWRNRRVYTSPAIELRSSALYARAGSARLPTIPGAPPVGPVDARAVERFYRQWYRASMMAVVVVGDVDVPRAESWIRETFASFETRPAVPLEDPGALAGQLPPVLVTADSHTTVATVEILHREPLEVRGARAAQRDGLADRLVGAAVERRLRETFERANMPALSVQMRLDVVGRTTIYRGVAIEFPAVYLTRGLALAMREMACVSTHGLHSDDLKRAQTDVMRALRRDAATEDRPSDSYADAYVRKYLEQQSLITGDADGALGRDLMRGMRSEDVTTALRRWLGRRDRIVLATVPAQLSSPGVASEIRHVLDAPPPLRPSRNGEQAVSARLDTVQGRGHIIKEERFAGPGVVRWTLSNGARVVFKPTRFNRNEVLLHGYRAGGWSLMDDAKLPSARFAGDLLARSGIGSLSAAGVDRALADRDVEVSATIGPYSADIYGRSSPEDLEIMFHVTHLRMTRPRLDKGSLIRWREVTRPRLVAASRRVETVLERVLAAGDWRRRAVEASNVDAVDPDAALRFYQEQFRATRDFTFIIVGEANTDSVRCLVERYLATLPASVHAEQAPLAPDIPSRAATQVLEILEDSVAVAYTSFGGVIAAHPAQIYLVRTLAELIRMRATWRLRHELGGTYAVDVRARTGTTPRSSFEIAIEFRTAPERVATLREQLESIIRELQAIGPTRRELTHVSEAQRRDAEVGMHQNTFWLGALRETEMAGMEPGERPLTLDASDAAAIDLLRDAAIAYLDWSSCRRVTLLPRSR